MLGSFTARRMRSAWPLVPCLAVTVLVYFALVSALVSFCTDALPATVNSELAGSGAMWVAVNGNASGRPGAAAAALAARLTTAFGAVPIRSYQATWSDDLGATRAAGGRPGTGCSGRRRWRDQGECPAEQR